MRKTLRTGSMAMVSADTIFLSDRTWSPPRRPMEHKPLMEHMAVATAAKLETWPWLQ